MLTCMWPVVLTLQWACGLRWLRTAALKTNSPHKISQQVFDWTCAAMISKPYFLMRAWCALSLCCWWSADPYALTISQAVNGTTSAICTEKPKTTARSLQHFLPARRCESMLTPNQTSATNSLSKTGSDHSMVLRVEHEFQKECAALILSNNRNRN